ncbi:bacterioferritin-associated ferredoxin [Halotalea alkalilenta]|uniref:Bacterioferritin-associated ferredoxin n=1 Tax=Halotalea alkalilenta TaxID=376489 RepID=A0A172YJ37_9GAMM|nr:bacterioferritin-associated ferredoxin [Halotalea alkalilenta]ANF59065.1 (2Fe-2S)-binding protein [Halotalea alkalilenta]
MYVCLCKGVTDRQLRQAVEEGASSWKEVREATGCASQCCKCARVGKEIVRDALAELEPRFDLAYAV